MGWIHTTLEQAVRKRTKLEEEEWINYNTDRQFAINRIYSDVYSLYSYVGQIKKNKSNALAAILNFLTSYDRFDDEQIKCIRIECKKLSDI